MEHCTRKGEPKLLKKCTMPLTAIHCVDVIVTELCTIHLTESGFLVTAMAPGVTKEELQNKTEAELTFAEEIEIMIL